MTSQLWISVRFLGQRYHGVEWPPGPAKLLQALVAGANAGCRVLEWAQVRGALRYLERLSPPAIVVPEHTECFAYKSYVPNNDSDSKAVVKRVQQGCPLADAMRKEAMISPKGSAALMFGQEDAVIHYVWRLPANMSPDDRQQAEMVCRSTRTLFALGWGIDVAVADGKILSSGVPPPAGKHYIPASEAGDVVLKVPTEGFVRDLEKTYKAFCSRTQGDAVDADARPRALRLVPYRIADKPMARLAVAFELLDPIGEERQSFRWEDGMLVASWLRHAAKQRFLLEGWDNHRVDSYVCGHTAKGEENNRLSYVPLPSIGHIHSDGRHRRALIVLPFSDTNAEESVSILRRMAGDPLHSLDSSAPVCWLSKDASELGRDRVLARYLREAREWATVTPIVLHGRDRNGDRFRLRKAEKLLLQAFAESGYPVDSIAEFSFQPAPFWRGCGSSRSARVPRHLGKWPRYHVRVTFQDPVRGPVIVGIGRHYGQGAFAGL